jgi:hypothetical protein
MDTSRVGPPRTDVPDITLERYRLGELSPSAMRRLDQCVAGDDVLRERLAVLARADEAAQGAYPPDAMASDVRRRLQAAPGDDSPSVRLGGWALPLAATALLVLVVARAGDWQATGRSSGDPTGAPVEGRAKGSDATLVLYRNTDAGAAILADGQRVRTGDVVRIGYRVTRPLYGAIMSVDGRGVVSRHLPDIGTAAVALVPGDMVLLDRAFELDDAPQVERFFLISATEPFELAPVLDAIRDAGRGAAPDPDALRLPDAFATTAFSLVKESRP